MHFNSRPHGGRHICRRIALTLAYFNSRPHGGRRYEISVRNQNIYFNSRPHGGRLIVGELNSVYISFQLTPSRRATNHIVHNLPVKPISTHALTEGDVIFLVPVPDASVFQLTPSRRATLLDNFRQNLDTFQLTPSRRATHSDIFPQRGRGNFNSRPHGGRP